MQLAVQPSSQSQEFALQRAFPKESEPSGDSFDAYLRNTLQSEPDGQTSESVALERTDERHADKSTLTKDGAAEQTQVYSVGDTDKTREPIDAETNPDQSHAEVADEPVSSREDKVTKPSHSGGDGEPNKTPEARKAAALIAKKRLRFDASASEVGDVKRAARGEDQTSASDKLEAKTTRVSESRIDIEVPLASPKVEGEEIDASTQKSPKFDSLSLSRSGADGHATDPIAVTDARDRKSDPKPASSEVRLTASLAEEGDSSVRSAIDSKESVERDTATEPTPASTPKHREMGNQAPGGENRNGSQAGESTPTQGLSSQTVDSGDGSADARPFESITTQSQSTIRTSVQTNVTLAQNSSTLRAALNESLNAEIVRSARVVVRGAEAGEIRLNIKPEELGRVRIALNMRDGHIAGRIIVENQSVREVFEQNMAQLEKAFAESGLAADGIEVTLADARAESDAERGQEHRSGSRVADRFDESVPLIEMYEERHELVDVMA